MKVKKQKKPQKSGIPLYVRIESLLRNKILNGQLHPGARLPNEEDLVQQYGVSRITIRTALSHLEREGLIHRSQAIGTFVSKDIPGSRKFLITSDVDDALMVVGKYQVRNISIETLPIGETRNPREVQRFFNLPDDSRITVVHRTRVLNGDPLYLVDNYVLPEVGERLNPHEMQEKPLLNILKDKIGLIVGRGEMYLEAIQAEPDIAAPLRVHMFEPLILRQLCYYDPLGKPFSIVFCYMKPEYFRYKAEIAGTQS